MKKTFSNGFGQMSLTKDEYIKHWLSTTHQYASLFYRVGKGNELVSFQCDLEDVAAKMWDDHKSEDVNQVTM